MPYYNYYQPGAQYYPQNFNPNPGTPVNTQSTSDQFITIPVTSHQQVEIYPVAAGTTVMFIDSDNKRLYSKTNPGAGMSSFIKTYDLHEESSDYVKDTKETVTKDEFDQAIHSLKKSISDINSILDDLTK